MFDQPVNRCYQNNAKILNIAIFDLAHQAQLKATKNILGITYCGIIASVSQCKLDGKMLAVKAPVPEIFFVLTGIEWILMLPSFEGVASSRLQRGVTEIPFGQRCISRGGTCTIDGVTAFFSPSTFYSRPFILPPFVLYFIALLVG